MTEYTNESANASAANSTNAAGVSLTALRDGSTAAYGAYSIDRNEWSLGFDFTGAKNIGKLRYYSLAYNDRAKNGVVEYWNGSTWVKIPVTSVADNASLYNTDEVQFSNANGWNTVIFTPVLATKFRVRWTVSWQIGDNNSTISEIEMYSVAGWSHVSKAGGISQLNISKFLGVTKNNIAKIGGTAV